MMGYVAFWARLQYKPAEMVIPRVPRSTARDRRRRAARQAGGLSGRAEQSSRKGLAGALTGEDHDRRLLRSRHNRVARATGKSGAQVYRLGARDAMNATLKPVTGAFEKTKGWLDWYEAFAAASSPRPAALAATKPSSPPLAGSAPR